MLLEWDDISNSNLSHQQIKLTSQKRREEDENFEEKRMNLSVKEKQQEVERPSPTTRREPWRPGSERDGQADKSTQRARQPDFRQDSGERRFNRDRKSPPKRYVSCNLHLINIFSMFLA